MPHDVILPQMGESIAEGTITTWLKQVGQTVARDEPLFEMSTDKVDAEIPSPVAGTLLEIKVQPGQTVPINTVVAVIGKDGEAAKSGNGAAAPEPKPSAGSSSPTMAAPKPAVAPASPAPSRPAPPASEARSARPAPVPAAPASASKLPSVDVPSADVPSVEERRRTKSSPVVRKIARQHGVDVSSISGTGISGRVTKRDILSHIESGAPAARGPAAAAPVAAAGPERARVASAGVPAGGAAVQSALQIPEAYRAKIYEGDQVEEMSRMRSLIADHMVLSRRVSAHVQTVWEVDFSHVANLRKQHKDVWTSRHGANLTFTSFIMKATVDALKAFPVINASVADNQIIYHRDVNLGMAVALDWGLIVPVIVRANELNLLGLTRALTDLGERARDKKLKPHEVQDGTFTITNPGVFGNLFGLPVINQPQVAILGVGGIEKRPVVVADVAGDMIAIRTRAYVSLSFDHRLVDGAIADQFMARVKKGIEQFDGSEL